MNIILFYVLRKFFVKLTITSDKIILEKRIILRKTTVLNLADIVRTQVRRTYLMRVLKAKEITLFTQNGKILFFLSEDENPDILPKRGKISLKPSFPERLFGAFIDTRALAGILVFALTLRKIGSVFRENYLDGVIRVMFTTAENVAKALSIIHIVLPRTAVFLGIFALASWIYAFLRKLISLTGFELSADKTSVYVKSGLITLYENALVRNTAAAVERTTFFSLLAKRSPLYYHSVMLFPCVNAKTRSRLLKSFLKIKIPEQNVLKSPARAFFGHCALPLWFFTGFLAMLIFLTLSKVRPLPIFRTALFAGIVISAYLAVLFFFYMRNAETSFSDKFVKISSRKSAALYTAYFPSELTVETVFLQNVFQRTSKIRSIKITLIGKKSFKARLIREQQSFSQ